MDFSNLSCFFAQTEDKATKNDNWNFWFRFFWVQKWPFRDGWLFSKIGFLNPLSLQCFLGALFFWAKLSKRGKFGPPPKKRKKFTDDWKAHLLVFLGFYVSSFFTLLFYFLFVFLLRATSPGPKPSLSFFLSFFGVRSKMPVSPAYISLFCQCLPLFLLTSLFSLSLSLFLSLSLSLLFFSFFLVSLRFAFLFLGLSLFALFICFCFMKRTTSKH